MSPRRPIGRPPVRRAERLPRLLALLPWLRAHPGVRVGEAAGEFGVTEAQLRDDLDLLLWCGLPGQGPMDLVDLEIDGDRITVLDAQTLDRPPRLTGDEALALVVAAQALADVPGLDRDAALARALVKLQGALVADPAAAADPARPPSLQVDLTAGDEDPAVVAAVRDALERRRRLHLRYLVERRDELTERTVDPVTLHVTEGRLYLQAWDRAREGMRLFRLDRVRSVALLDEPSTPPPNAARDLAEGMFAPSPADLAVTLELAARARWLADAYPCEVLSEDAAGGLTVLLRTPDTGWLVRLVVGLGGAAQVREPAEVRADVRAAAAAALAAYRT